ncbi:hypothetical protein Tco_0000757 [Tanacetum coccineum]
MTHPSPKRNMVPKAVLMRSGLVSFTTARPVNTAQPKSTVNSARPMTNVFNKAYSTVRIPINNKTATKNNNFNQRVNTVSGKNVNTARPKAVVNAARLKAVLNAVKGNQVNAVKASTCWVWKPKTKIQVSDGLGPQKRLIFLPRVQGNPQIDLQDQGVIDNGCSRNKTGRIVLFTDFDEIMEDLLPLDHDYCRSRVKVIRCDNRTEFKNKEMNQFCGEEKDNARLILSYCYFLGVAVYMLCIKACDDACKARIETVPGKDYILLPLWPADLPFSQNSKSSPDAGFKPSGDNEKKVTEEPGKEGGDSSNDQEKEDDNVNITNNINTASDGNNIHQIFWLILFVQLVRTAA